MKYRFGSFALLFVTILSLFVIDRMLLSTFKLRHWMSDPVLHYKHRPGTYSWGKHYGNKPIYINQHGFHDDDFSERKPDKELRGLILGDSIVMGHGVTAAETFTNQLETLLPGNVSGYDTFQVINAGVQGYSTFQYLETLKRSMKFSPDFIAIGFCMNDVTEPYMVNKSYGGSGIDYHGILQISQPWLAYIINETGIGRLAIDIRGRIKSRWASTDQLARAEIYNVRKMAEHSDTNPIYIKAWTHVLSDLSEIYDFANNKNLPVVLLILPHTFQLEHEELQKPQRILKQHADLHKVPYLDMTEAAEKLLSENVPLTDLFLDRDHYTVKGHGVVANLLLELLQSKGVF